MNKHPIQLNGITIPRVKAYSPWSCEAKYNDDAEGVDHTACMYYMDLLMNGGIRTYISYDDENKRYLFIYSFSFVDSDITVFVAQSAMDDLLFFSMLNGAFNIDEKENKGDGTATGEPE